MPPRRSLRDRLPGLARPEPLPSLFDRHPQAGTATRRPRGIQVVPLERIVGTVRNPSQNTNDFLPLPGLRGRNWHGRWQRISAATDNLSILPAVDLLQVGDEYYVEDGHNRIAAALRNGAVAIDADVTELVLPGMQPSREDDEAPHADAATILLGSDEVRQAVAGRPPRTQVAGTRIDQLRREELTRPAEELPDELPEPPADA